MICCLAGLEPNGRVEGEEDDEEQIRRLQFKGSPSAQSGLIWREDEEEKSNQPNGHTVDIPFPSSDLVWDGTSRTEPKADKGQRNCLQVPGTGGPRASSQSFPTNGEHGVDRSASYGASKTPQASEAICGSPDGATVTDQEPSQVVVIQCPVSGSSSSSASNNAVQYCVVPPQSSRPSLDPLLKAHHHHHYH